MLLDGMRQADQGGLSETLRQCFFSNGTSDSAITVFKWVDNGQLQLRSNFSLGIFVI